MKLSQQLIRTAGIWLILVVSLFLTDPGRLPVVVLIAPFVLLYAACYSTWKLIQAVRARFWTKETAMKTHRPLGMALSLSAVLLLVLQSLGQLSVRDVITVVAIVVLGYLYFGRSRFVLPKK